MTKLNDMGKLIVSFFACLLLCLPAAQCQLNDDFSDGDFIRNPVWVGSTNAFLVNGSHELQSNSLTANETFYLSTAQTLAVAVQWEFSVRFEFNTSSTNYCDIYLVASDAELLSESNTGYFVRIGNTKDEISLYRRDGVGQTLLIDGEDRTLDKSNSKLKIKVSRDTQGKWMLWRSVDGSGYLLEGSANDNRYTESAYFGILIRQSTSTFFQKHFFDDITVSNFVPDTQPPQIKETTVISDHQLDILFDEPVDAGSAAEQDNYVAGGGIGSPATAEPDAANPALVHLSFAQPFANGNEYTLDINGIKDIIGNAATHVTVRFVYYKSKIYDVVINEIMADPSPPVALPDNKWIELKNNSRYALNLRGWTIGHSNGVTGLLPDFTLQPDSFVLVCAASSLSSMSTYGGVIAVTNFPGLVQSGELIYLKNEKHETIHAVQYDAAWYGNELKKAGGWSLEMIDANKACTGVANWSASTGTAGGTPGRPNSIAGISAENSAAKLLRTYVETDNTIVLYFDKTLDSITASNQDAYILTNGLSAASVVVNAPLFNSVTLTTTSPIFEGTMYNITVNGLADCTGNPVTDNDALFARASTAAPMDLVINEILFNPRPAGADYVELYNRSQKAIDLAAIYLANRSSTNEISNLTQVMSGHQIVFPGDYALLTSQVQPVLDEYPSSVKSSFVQMRSLPSFPDDKGNVVITNQQGEIIDEVVYSEKWHFPLITNPEGVSLERLNADGESVQSNFHSASTTAGYGTPGAKNSQQLITDPFKGMIDLSHEVFSPDNDGTDDFLTINYKFPAAGFVTNITIFDANGRMVRRLQKNSLSGINGYYKWDGLGEQNNKLAQGIYIIFTEIFSSDGVKKIFKNTVVLARRF